MQTKTLRRLINPVGSAASLTTDDAIQHAKVALRARRKRQRANRKTGRVSR